MQKKMQSMEGQFDTYTEQARTLPYISFGLDSIDSLKTIG